ncbi:MAG: ERF family protein [Kiritimatiellae bacterium]|nr:ERF family protein [Kiritimatiellia bacterium]
MSATPDKAKGEAAAKAALAAKRKAEADAEQAKLDEWRRDVPPGVGEVEAQAKAAATIRAKLLAIQTKLRVTKDRGKGHNPNAQVTYEYRNAEDILEAVKPLCAEVGAVVTVDVVPKVIGEAVPVKIEVVGKDKYKNDILAMLSGPRFVAVATATLSDCATGESVSASSFAFVDAWRKGQTEPEKLCGSADSYASKYALGHLFALDNNRDADMESDGANNGADAPTTTPPDLGF